jgi:hypothetical protein
MTIRLILAPLTGGKRDALTLASAFAAAEPLKAHVRALFVRPDPTEALPFFGDEVAPAMANEIVDAAREAADASSASAQASLNAAAAAAEFEALEQPAPGPSVSFFEMKGHFADCVTRAGQLADLIVFGPLREGDHPGLAEAFEASLLKSGSPILLGSMTSREPLRASPSAGTRAPPAPMPCARHFPIWRRRKPFRSSWCREPVSPKRISKA